MKTTKQPFNVVQPKPAADRKAAHAVATPTVEVSEKYGATLNLNPASKWPFRFGVGKAKLILSNLDAIQAFVAEYDEAQDKAA